MNDFPQDMTKQVPDIARRPSPIPTPPKDVDRSSNGAGRPLFFGLFVILVVFVAAPYFSSKTMIESAIVAQGELNNIGNKSFIQHETGGVIKEVLVKNGTNVDAGDELFILDSTIEKADLQDLKIQLQTQIATTQRYTYFLNNLNIPVELAELGGTNEQLIVQSLKSLQNQRLTDQREIFSTQRNIESLNLAEGALDKQLSLLNARLDVQKDLLEKKLTDKSRIDAIELEVVENEIELQRLLRQIIENEAKISSLEKQIEQRDIEFKKTILEELLVTNQSIERLKQAIIKNEHVISRKTIYATVSGTITNMLELGLGAVVSPQQNLAEIIPQSREITARILVIDTDISGVALGDQARVQLQTNSENKDLKFLGEVSLISADRLAEEDLNRFYEVIVTLDPTDFEDISLPNGLSVVGYLSTEPQSVLAYVLEPVIAASRDIFVEK